MIPVFRPYFGEEEKTLLSRVIDSQWVSEGAFTRQFEEELAKYLGVKYVVCVTSGGVALLLAIMSQRRKEHRFSVAMPVYQHISLANSVTLLKDTPFFIDVYPMSGLLNMHSIKPGNLDLVKESLWTSVSMNGRYSSYRVDVEDDCQALASTWNGKHLQAKVGCLSFHPTKILTTGQGGAIFTDDQEAYEKVKALKDYGRFVDRTSGKEIPDYYNSWGMNFRFTEMQAAIGLAQLGRVEARGKRVREIYDRYMDEIKIPHEERTEQNGFVPWVCDIQFFKLGLNEELKSKLAERNIETRLPYRPLHQQPLYIGRTGDYSGADWWSGTCLWLPSSPSLSDEEVDTVIKEMNKLGENL